MIFIWKLIKALWLKSKLKRYIKERKLAIADEKRKHNWWNRFRRWLHRRIPFFPSPDEEVVKTSLNQSEKFRIKLFTDGTYENYVLKSIVGFISGIFLTYMFFIFFILQLNFPLKSATTMCSIFGLILSLGLAYSFKVRCVVFMLLPQFFSKRGRQALVAYAFILTLTGPAKNALHNMRVLSETMACGQGKLKNAVTSLVDLIKQPFRAIKESMKQVMVKVKAVVEKVKEMMMAIKKVIQSIIGVIKDAYDWLNSVVAMCGKRLGTPFERCEKAFELAYDDCLDKVPSLLAGLCEITNLVQGTCYIVKPIDYVCELFEFISDDLVSQVKTKFKEFTSQMKNIFYVSVKFSHSFDFHTEQSKTIREIAAGIMAEVKHRSEAVVYFFDWMSFVFSFFFLYMLLQVLNYKRKYMSSDWFDNHFITDNIVHIDIQRTRRGLETILPLNVHERKKYVQVASIRLVKREQRALTKSAVFLGLSTVKLSIHMLTDYSLWWVLKMMRYHGQFQSAVDNPANIKVVVDGKGMLADLYGAILNTFQPSGVKFNLDTTPCLPDPIPPDLSRYRQIASLIILAWVLSICEPYGLRLRNSAMGYYYPARARVRALWLYNHILRARGSFLKYARRQLRRLFTKDKAIEKVSLMDRLRATFPWLHKICKGKKLVTCRLCGVLESSDLPLIRCPRPDCIGIYCVPCYAQLLNICTICKLPIEYGDLSDISEERDSSDEISPSAGVGDVTSISASDTTGALLEDTAESELSYEYQYQERAINEDISEIPPAFHDTEAQIPRTRVTLDDYAFPAHHQSEEGKRKMTLAQRKQSGFWSMIREPEAKRRISSSSDDELETSEILGLTRVSRQLPSILKNPSSLLFNNETNENEDEHAPLLAEQESDAEQSENNSDPLIALKSPSKLREIKIMSKFFNIPDEPDRKRKTEEIDQTFKEVDENKDVETKSIINYGGIKASNELINLSDSETKKTSVEGSRISLKQEEPPSVSHINTDTPDDIDNDSEDRIQIGYTNKRTAKFLKAPQMIKNWIKTGCYHNANQPKKVSFSVQTEPHLAVGSKQAASGFKNPMKRKRHEEEREDTEKLLLHEHSSDKENVPEQQKEVKKTMTGKIWDILKRRKKESPDIIHKEDVTEVNLIQMSEISLNTKEVAQRFSVENTEKESFTSIKGSLTPAKIVHERFRIEE